MFFGFVISAPLGEHHRGMFSTCAWIEMPIVRSVAAAFFMSEFVEMMI